MTYGRKLPGYRLLLEAIQAVHQATQDELNEDKDIMSEFVIQLYARRNENFHDRTHLICKQVVAVCVKQFHVWPAEACLFLDCQLGDRHEIARMIDQSETRDRWILQPCASSGAFHVYCPSRVQAEFQDSKTPVSAEAWRMKFMNPN